MSCDARAGECLAVLGPSGAGKSTFLDLVAGRKTCGFGKGEVLYDGVPPTREDRRETQCYVMQRDVMIAALTVGETVRVAAALRLGRRSAAKAVRAFERARVVLRLLDLDAASSRLVKDLAQGERRLCAAAVEMVHLPPVCFLDEPTSGLDSATALRFVRALGRVAATNATVVCTIHQPSEVAFAAFAACLVVGDGREIFFGAPGDAREALLAEPELGPTSMDDGPIAEWLVAAAARAAGGPAGGLAEPVANGFDLDRDFTVARAPRRSLARQLDHFRARRPSGASKRARRSSSDFSASRGRGVAATRPRNIHVAAAASPPGLEMSDSRIVAARVPGRGARAPAGRGRRRKSRRPPRAPAAARGTRPRAPRPPPPPAPAWSQLSVFVLRVGGGARRRRENPTTTRGARAAATACA